MSTESPSQVPPAEAPKPTAERALAAVPVVLTVMATVLAGLSSNEMTRSMYYRSLAAQNQAKSGSQWEFFQAKRIRGTTLEAVADLARGQVDMPLTDAAQLGALMNRVVTAVRQVADTGGQSSEAADRLTKSAQKLDALLKSDEGRKGLRYLTGHELPSIDAQGTDDPAIRSIVQAIRTRQTEAQTKDTVAKIDLDRLQEAIDRAETNAEAFDKASRPLNQFIRMLDSTLDEIRGELRHIDRPDNDKPVTEARSALKDASAGLRVARQDLTARRYAAEAGYNQASAELYEVLVRRNGFESDRHRERSKNFFYAMLCAQAGVTVAAFALARSRKSLFWGFAGFAGVLALSFGAYVYVAM